MVGTFALAPFVLGAALFGAMVLTLGGERFDPRGDPEGPEEMLFVVASSLAQMGLTVMVAFLLPRVRRFGATRAYGLYEQSTQRCWTMAVAVLLLALPWLIGASWLVEWLHALAGSEPAEQDVVEMMRDAVPWNQAGMLALALVLAPVAEELLFRGVLLPVMVRRMGAWPAIVTNGLLFGAVHMHLPSLLPLSLLGMALCAAAIHSRGVLVPILVHFLFNALNTAMILLE